MGQQKKRKKEEGKKRQFNNMMSSANFAGFTVRAEVLIRPAIIRLDGPGIRRLHTHPVTNFDLVLTLKKWPRMLERRREVLHVADFELVADQTVKPYEPHKHVRQCTHCPKLSRRDASFSERCISL